jgi:hypothetical protein
LNKRIKRIGVMIMRLLSFDLKLNFLSTKTIDANTSAVDAGGLIINKPIQIIHQIKG